MNNKTPQFNFQQLKVWQEAMKLIEIIYRITKSFPREEQFGIVSQLRRAATSIALNIAEGKGRYHTKEFIQFLYLARGSLYETITLLQISQNLAYLKKIDSDNLLIRAYQIANQIGALINYLKK